MNIVSRTKSLASLRFRSRSINLVNCRFSSHDNLPQPAKNQGGQVEQKDPENPLVFPTKQALLAKIPVEYHGIAKANFDDETIWLPLFIWPYVSHFRFFFRMKSYLTLGSLGFCGVNIYELYAGNPNVPILGSCLLAATTLTGLTITGALSRKIIGRIYVSEEGKSLRVGRFSFWGFRRDIVVPMECVIPLTELNEDNRKLFANMRFHAPQNIDLSTDAIEFYEQNHLLPLKLGGVTDATMFENYLGKILTKKKLMQYK